MAHTTEDNRHPMEGTKDSAGSRESFKKRNADEWTKGRQKKKETQKAEAESPPRRTHTSWGCRKVTLGTKKGINPPKIPQGRPSGEKKKR